jgi:hypothetical protein
MEANNMQTTKIKHYRSIGTVDASTVDASTGENTYVA